MIQAKLTLVSLLDVSFKESFKRKNKKTQNSKLFQNGTVAAIFSILIIIYQIQWIISTSLFHLIKEIECLPLWCKSFFPSESLSRLILLPPFFTKGAFMGGSVFVAVWKRVWSKMLPSLLPPCCCSYIDVIKNGVEVTRDFFCEFCEVWWTPGNGVIALSSKDLLFKVSSCGDKKEKKTWKNAFSIKFFFFVLNRIFQFFFAYKFSF